MEQEDPDKVFVNWHSSSRSKLNSDADAADFEEDNIDEQYEMQFNYLNMQLI